MNKKFRATEISHMLLSQFLKGGEWVVDATAGNGNDTLFLAEKVGPGGRVFAFDLQAEALAQSQQIIEKHGYDQRVTFIHGGHEHLTKHINQPVRAIIYNLGYLPGGDKSIVTRVETTLQSLRQGLDLLEEGGIISLTLYRGHPGGQEEAAQVEELLQSLSSPPWQIMTWQKLNGSSNSPVLVIVHKGGSF